MPYGTPTSNPASLQYQANYFNVGSPIGSVIIDIKMTTTGNSNTLSEAAQDAIFQEVIDLMATATLVEPGTDLLKIDPLRSEITPTP